MENVTENNVLEALESVVDPTTQNDIVKAGLVKGVSISKDSIKVIIKASDPTAHAKERMKEACAFALERKFGKEIASEITFEELTEDEKIATRAVLPGVKNIIAVASGKGGVGKSTIAANLAVGLAKRGYKVGCIDADIYGPSMPLMLDVAQERPSTVEKDGKVLMKPVENYGVKMLSIGFFADPAQAIVWRGPMASKALKQLFADTDWGDLDFMIIDLPPGTGDIHLSVVQMVPLTGAVIVSTPQKVALADARKGVEMFRLPNINVPVLGVVQNMAWFTPEELPDNKYYIFGKDGVKTLAEDIDTTFLGDIPFGTVSPRIR